MSDVQSDPVIVVSDVSKRYGRTIALRHVDLEVQRGEFVVLSGPSGSGKSTLLNLLAALERPDSGSISIDGHPLGRHARHLNDLRRFEVGIVFQLHNLVPRLTARENIEVAMFGTHRGARERADRATELLQRLDLGDRATDRPPTLSGGERQRVAIARALANEPSVILADEPTGSLDDASADLVLDLFADVRDAGATILAVSHDARLDARADRIVELHPRPDLSGPLHQRVAVRVSDMQNDLDDDRAPDPNAGVTTRGQERPAQGRDESDDDAESSLHPGGHTKDGPRSDDARAQPYDEQPIGLRMVDQPLDEDANDANRMDASPDGRGDEEP